MTPKQFRTLRGDYTLSELSLMIGVTTRTIRRYEDGTRDISKPVQILMCLVHEGRLCIENEDYISDILKGM